MWTELLKFLVIFNRVSINFYSFTSQLLKRQHIQYFFSFISFIFQNQNENIYYKLYSWHICLVVVLNQGIIDAKFTWQPYYSLVPSTFYTYGAQIWKFDFRKIEIKIKTNAIINNKSFSACVQWYMCVAIGYMYSSTSVAVMDI